MPWSLLVALAVVVAVVAYLKRGQAKAYVLKAETGTYDAWHTALDALKPMQPLKMAAKAADAVLDSTLPVAEAVAVVVPGIAVPVKIAEAVDQGIDKALDHPA